MKKKKNPSQLALFDMNEPEKQNANEQVNESFEEQSPMLNEDVIERKNDIVLEAQPVNNPLVEEVEKPVPPRGFGKPTLNVATPTEDKEKEEKGTKITAEESLPPMGEAPISPSSKENEQAEKPEVQEEGPKDDLPKMKGEHKEEPTLQNIQNKAGQTTAKWSWTLFENAGPKLQLFLTELDEPEIRKLIVDDLLPEQALEFAKEYNESLAEEFAIKDWEKELIYPPLEEMLEQAGMNASMSPGARFGLGVAVVLGTRAMQTKKYRAERDELVERLLKSYARSKEPGSPSN